MFTRKIPLLLGLLNPISAFQPQTLASPKIPSKLPSFVTEFAPLVHLYSKDPYRPSDISAQLLNTRPYTSNYTPISNPPNPLTLNSLNSLNSYGKVYLTSTLDPTTSPRPPYLYGVSPSPSGETPNATSATIILVDHGNATVDVFYMYFYAFDYGGDYLARQINVGNHVGDWEHNMLRFVEGKPREMWFSQHAGGQAFEYSAVEKFEGGGRPVVYSANGTHANYAKPGTHDHTIPGVDLPVGLLEDHTDAGPLWDPTLSAYYYSFDPQTSKFEAYDDDDESTPVAWLYFTGNWGDEKYAKSDPRQDCPLGVDALCRYSGGPTGPIDKDLDRKNVCPDSQEICIALPLVL
ncbi:related to VPS62 Vacuolar Protein Sorting [Ramularia collo-cygni]|uniref:Related to VPS62 Vacuolar Protein Sorting n=1 Tax=Ramularia collo-cygni TaxID=112498 RepID=A0A2D3UTT6_9PEZI|nr:related to VPS62 Vacuolar Protein Sorting [Ramularia collo-cygni]CZT15287.1 related to VPS62 Vacuolar Protein Sorting [Ramularia collo-cygni]